MISARKITLFIAVLAALGPRTSRAQWNIDGRALCLSANDQIGPVTVPDGSGGAILAWEDGRGSSYDIYVQRVSSGGVPLWTAQGVALCVAANDQRRPMIAPDGSGGAIVAWYDFRNGSHEDIYVRRISAAGTPMWTDDGVAVCTAVAEQLFPTIVPDGAGGAVVTWEDYRGGVANSDIYAQRVLSTGVVDAAWPANGRALCTAASLQQFPTIVSDDASGAIVTWRDFRSETNFDIYAQRVLANGAVAGGWPVDGRALCTADLNQYDPVLAPDGAGGAIVTWEDQRGSVSDVYAQRVLANGSADPAWPTNGRAVCGAAGIQIFPAIVSDAAGGAIVTWEDYRNDPDLPDIYVQRVRSTGVVDPAWPADGRGVCTAVESQFNPTIAPDGSSGALIAWHDYRNLTHSDVYVQHVSPTGAIDPQWPANGRVLSAAGHSQQYTAIAGDGVGGAIVAWQDFRNTVDFDIYALRVYPSGGVAAVSPITHSRAFDQLPPFPNPTRGRPITIGFELAREGLVSVAVHDVTGRQVRSLLRESRPSGTHHLRWDGRDESGAAVPEGLYFARVSVDGVSDSRRITLVR